MTEWRTLKIGQFLFEREGRYKPTDKQLEGVGRIEKIDFSGKFFIAQKPSKTDMILIKPGDLVISGINVAKGAIGVYEGDQNVTATIHYSAYTFDTQQINVEYFKRFVKSPEFIRLLQQEVKGGIKTEIKAKHLLPLEIILPDTTTQHSIVGFFQRTETENEELASEITVQRTLLQKFRQAILQEAVQGKLTAAWRQAHPDVEPASELLTRIQAEKAQLIKEKKIKKQKPLPPIKDEEIPFKLPKGWMWCRLGEVAEHCLGKMLDHNKNRGQYQPYLRNLNIRWKGFELDDLKEMRFEDHEEERYGIKNGDLLICEGGEPGRAAIWKEEIENMKIQKAIHRVRFFDGIDSEFFLNYLMWSAKSEYLDEYFTGSGIKHLTGKSLAKFIFPLPSTVEQKTITSKVNHLMSYCNQLEQQITLSQTTAEQLMQAVLREAFTTS